jgi:hypothetical protein
MMNLTLRKSKLHSCRSIPSSFSNFLPKRERKGLNAGIKEFDLNRSVFYSTLLPDELIESGLSNLAGAVRGGIDSTIVAGRRAVQLYLEANGLAVLRRA